MHNCLTLHLTMITATNTYKQKRVQNSVSILWMDCLETKADQRSRQCTATLLIQFYVVIARGHIIPLAGIKIIITILTNCTFQLGKPNMRHIPALQAPRCTVLPSGWGTAYPRAQAPPQCFLCHSCVWTKNKVPAHVK
jgi:hypothetical protein